MPKINRSKTFYHELPESMATKTLTDMNMQVSINMTIPKELQGKADSFIEDIQSEIKDAFKKWSKKQCKKFEEEE